MTQTVQAIFENGVLRPLGPLELRPNQRVVLRIDAANDRADEIEDRDFLAYARAEGDPTISLETVRQALAKVPGTMTDACTEERSED